VLAAGNHGVLLQSVDGGETWTGHDPVSSHRIHGGWMPDDQTVILVGEGGLIVRGSR